MSISPRLFMLAGLIALLGIAGQWTGGGTTLLWLPFAVLLLALAIFERLLLLTSQLLIKRGIVADKTGGTRLEPGKSAHYFIQISNSSSHPVQLESQACLPTAFQGGADLQQWFIGVGETQTRPFRILPIELGKHEFGTLYYRLLGRFGLIWWSRRFDNIDTLTVEPASIGDNEQIMGNQASGSRRMQQKTGGGSELLYMRDYQHGDPLRAIDWKATAKRNKTMVRIFSHEQRLEMVLMLDCGRSSRLSCGNMGRLQHYVNVASRLAQLAIGNEDRVGYVAYAGSICTSAPMAGGTKALAHLRKLLTNACTHTEESNPLAAALQTKNLLRHRGLVLFLTGIDQIEANGQLIKAAQLLSRKHHVIVAAIEDEAIDAMRTQTGSSWLSPYKNFAALEYQHNREISKRRLQQLGVTIVSAPAERIDRVVLNTYFALRAGVAV